MARRLQTAPLVLLLLVSWAAAQGNLKVQVTLGDGQPCKIGVHVQLLSSGSALAVAETYTNENGMAELYRLERGNYHLVVSGEGLETADSGVFEIDSHKLGQSIEVTVRRLQDSDDTTHTLSGSNMVAVAALNIPDGALKEFNKATDLMNRQEWKKAVERLNRAVGIYPQYAAAWNNLGAAYARLADRPREQEALEKAVNLDDHLAPAFVNLAKLSIADRNMARAETLLDKASGTDPANIQTLVLLANVELLNQHLDQAIATSRKVHSLTGAPHALVHYIAARACEHENRIADAIAEFETFLKEEPAGERANAVRKELSSLQSYSQ